MIKNNDIFLSFINGNLTEKAKKEEKKSVVQKNRAGEMGKNLFEI